MRRSTAILAFSVLVLSGAPLATAQSVNLNEVESTPLVADGAAPPLVDSLCPQLGCDPLYVMGPLYLGQERWVIVHAACDESACSLWAALLRSEAGVAVVEEKYELGQQKSWTGADVSAELPDIVDVQGDGESELLFRWTQCGKPEPAVGPACETLVAITSLRLAPLWRGLVAATGAGSQRDCSARFRAEDLDRDGFRDVLLDLNCWQAYCRVDPSLCADAAEESHYEYYWTPAESVFAERKPKPKN